MNELIKQLQNRRSVREFTGEKIKEEDIYRQCSQQLKGRQIQLMDSKLH